MSQTTTSSVPEEQLRRLLQDSGGTTEPSAAPDRDVDLVFVDRPPDEDVFAAGLIS